MLMRYRLMLLIAALSLCSARVYGQSIVTTPLLDSILDTRLLGSVTATFAATAGDTIVIAMEEVDGQAVQRIEIRDASSAFVRTAQQTPTFQERWVVLADTELSIVIKHSPRLNSPIPQRRKVRLRISRENWVVPPIIAINPFVDTSQQIVYDTTWRWHTIDTTIATLLDESYTLGATLSPDGTHRRALRLNPSPDASYYLYWIGVGKAGRQAYEQLQLAISPDWAAAGIVTPLDAYAKQKLFRLGSHTQGEDVSVAWLDTLSQFQWRNGLPSTPRKAEQGTVLYGRIDTTWLRDTIPLYMGLYNDNTVSPIDVRVRVVAVTINREWSPQVTERTITIRKVFRLNTDSLSANAAMAAHGRLQRELDAAIERETLRFEQLQRSLDSTKLARFTELALAQSNLDSTAIDIRRKAQDEQQQQAATTQQRIKRIEARMQETASVTDSMALSNLQEQLQTLLTSIQVAQSQLDLLMTRQAEIRALLQEDLKAKALQRTNTGIDAARQSLQKTAKEKIDSVTGDKADALKSILQQQLQE